MEDTPLFAARHVVSGYGRGTVIDGLSAHVGHGEIVGLIGRNGVGKTTFMRTLVGTLPLRQGALVLAGEDISGASAERRIRAGMGYVPQGRRLFESLSVQDNIAVCLRKGEDPKQQMRDLVAAFPIIHDRAKQRAGSLSGGQKQQVALARALALRPRLLLLDEPSEGIQPTIVIDMCNTIKKLVSGLSLGVLLVEQNIHVIQRLMQRAYVIEKGRCIRELSVDEIQDDATLIRYLTA